MSNIMKGGERTLHRWSIFSRQAVVWLGVLVAGFSAGWGMHMKLKTTPTEWHAASDAWLSMGRVRHHAQSSLAYRAWAYQSKAGLQAGAAGMVLSGFLLLMVFQKFGQIGDKTHKRGSRLISSQQLSKMIRRRSKVEPDLHLCGVPLPRNIELKHLLLAGGTGVGKSTVMRECLDQVRDKDERAIVFDPGGHFLSEYAAEGDVLLNPFDRRADNWSIFHEIDSERDAVRVAQSLVTSKGDGKDEGFVNGARAIMSALIWKLAQGGDPSMQKLYDWLVLSSHDDLAEFLAGTPGARHIGSGAAEQASGMLSFASENAGAVKAYGQASHLHGEPPFSLRKWVRQSETGIVWMPVQKSHISEALPLVSLWLDIAAAELMGMGEAKGRRMWFFADEVASLNKLESLPILLAEGRKYGGVGCLGFQNMSQLRLKYGRDGAGALLDLLSTKLIFRSSDPEVAKYSSELLGEAEVERKNEGESLGRGGRDGSSLSQQVLREPLVMPSQIQNLADFEAYMILPGDYPHARVHTVHKEREKKHPAFVEA